MGKELPTSSTDLPQRLRYLQPFRRKFASRPEELEYSGYAPLMALLSKRVRGLPPPEAENLLSLDLAALQEWLSDPPHQNDPLQFAFGVSLAASPADLVRFIREEAENPEPNFILHMKLPPGAKLRPIDGGREDGKVVMLKGLWLVIGAVPKEAVGGPASDNLFHLAPPDRWVPVHFGEASGHKHVNKKGDACGSPFKEVTYALTVPGGHVHATISAVGNVDPLNWDEAPFEACFHTLRVETKAAPPAEP
jgi:hypothetical protein